MEVHHKCRLVDLCRVCGCKLHRGVKAKGKAVKPEPSYSCISYADKLLVAFDINVAVDAAEIHPQKFCTLCFKAMSRVLVAKEQKNHVKCYVQLYNWHLHSHKGPSLFTPNLTALGPFIKIFLTPLRDSGASCRTTT